MLSKLKQIDLYRKVNSDLSSQTVSGGLLSIFSLLLIIYLFTSEFFCYLEYTPKLLIEPSDSSRIRVDLNISLHGIPCGLLSLLYSDISSQYYSNAYLKKVPIESGKILWETVQFFETSEKEAKVKCGPCYGAEIIIGQCCNTCEEVLEAYTSRGWKQPNPEEIGQCRHKATGPEMLRGEGCLIYGEIYTRKIPAQIRIETSAIAKHFANNLRTRFNGKHTINHLGFYDPEGLYEQGPLDGKEVFENFVTLYYLKVTPAIKDAKRFYHTTDSSLGIKEPTFPIIAISFDIEPITTVYQREKNFSEFIVSICAIIGGWFSITQILSKFIIN